VKHRTRHRTLLSLAPAAVVAGAATVLVVQVDASELRDRPVTSLPPTSVEPATSITMPTTTLPPTTTTLPPTTTTPPPTPAGGDEVAY
jgi:hypothetical protein